MIPPDLFYAWLGAPTPSQRWQVVKEIERYLNGQTHLLAVQMFWHERSPGLPRLETALRKFWTRVAILIKSRYQLKRIATDSLQSRSGQQ